MIKSKKQEIDATRQKLNLFLVHLFLDLFANPYL